MVATGSEAKLLPGLKADDTILTNIEILEHKRAAEVADRDWRGRGGRGVCVDLPELRHRSDDSGVFAAHGSGGGRGDFEGAGARVQQARHRDEIPARRWRRWRRPRPACSVSYTDANGKAQAKEAEKVLVAVGRGPLTSGIGLEKTKVELDRGAVKVNETQETAEPGVFAIGDIVAGLPQLAHVGAMSGMVAMAKIAGRRITGRCGAIGFRAALIPIRRSGQRGIDRSAGEGKGPRSQGGQVSVCRKFKGDDRGQPRRLCEGGRRRASTARFWACTSSGRRPRS